MRWIVSLVFCRVSNKGSTDRLKDLDEVLSLDVKLFVVIIGVLTVVNNFTTLC